MKSNRTFVSGCGYVAATLLCGSAFALFCANAFAQVASSALTGGQLNQQIQAMPPSVQQPSRDQAVPSVLDEGVRHLTGGPGGRVQVHAILFSGNSAISSAELANALPSFKADGSSIEDLNAIADAVTSYYRGKG